MKLKSRFSAKPYLHQQERADTAFVCTATPSHKLINRETFFSISVYRKQLRPPSQTKPIRPVFAQNAITASPASVATNQTTISSLRQICPSENSSSFVWCVRSRILQHFYAILSPAIFHSIMLLLPAVLFLFWFTEFRGAAAALERPTVRVHQQHLFHCSSFLDRLFAEWARGALLKRKWALGKLVCEIIGVRNKEVSEKKKERHRENAGKISCSLALYFNFN